MASQTQAPPLLTLRATRVPPYSRHRRSPRHRRAVPSGAPAPKAPHGPPPGRSPRRRLLLRQRGAGPIPLPPRQARRRPGQPGRLRHRQELRDEGARGEDRRAHLGGAGRSAPRASTSSATSAGTRCCRRKMLDAVREASPAVEYYSIDEFFFAADAGRGSRPQALAEELRDRLTAVGGRAGDGRHRPQQEPGQARLRHGQALRRPGPDRPRRRAGAAGPPPRHRDHRHRRPAGPRGWSPSASAPASTSPLADRKQHQEAAHRRRRNPLVGVERDARCSRCTPSGRRTRSSPAAAASARRRPTPTGCTPGWPATPSGWSRSWSTTSSRSAVSRSTSATRTADGGGYEIDLAQPTDRFDLLMEAGQALPGAGLGAGPARQPDAPDRHEAAPAGPRPAGALRAAGRAGAGRGQGEAGSQRQGGAVRPAQRGDAALVRHLPRPASRATTSATCAARCASEAPMLTAIALPRTRLPLRLIEHHAAGRA